MNLPVQISDFQEFENIQIPLHLAIGVFDGIHLGHIAVIEPSIAAARANGEQSAILTFHPHPSRLFKKDEGTELIMDLKSKTRRLHQIGVDVVIAKTFDQAFASIPADKFLSFLKKELPGIKAVYVGENFRFGQGRVGDIQTLIDSGKQLGVDVWSIDRIKQNGLAISSTRIRAALAAGEIESVNALLGYHYFSEGPIKSGSQLGRKIGFPTLNIGWSPESKPCYGVYAVRFKEETSEEWIDGIANYGIRPTVSKEGQKLPILEVHSFKPIDFDQDAILVVEWLYFIRKEQRFPDVEDLKNQISLDCKKAIKILQDARANH